MFVSMGATLARWRRDGFSETARSRPRHRPARRHVLGARRGVLAVLARRAADDLAERAAERPQAGEADVEADLGDAAVGVAQQRHRALDAPALQIAVRRLAERLAEGADEVRLGDVDAA